MKTPCGFESIRTPMAYDDLLNSLYTGAKRWVEEGEVPAAGLLVAALALLAAWPVWGQSPAYDPHPDYLVKKWSVEDGLPVNHITDMLQSRDGYLWMTTFDGLVRFDGQRFTAFSTVNSPGLSSNRLLLLHEDGTGALWMLTESGDVVRFANGLFTSFADDLDGPAESFHQDADTLWVTTQRGVMRYVGGAMRPFRPDLFGRQRTWSVLREGAGSLWIFGERALTRIQPDGSSRQFTTADGVPGNEDGLLEAGIVFEDRSGTIWAGTRAGIARLRGERFEYFLRTGPRGAEANPAIQEDAGGTIWFGTATGWWTLRDGRAEAFAGAGQPAQDYFAGTKLVSEPDGSTWRTQGAWLYRNEDRILHLKSEESWRHSLRAILFDREGNLWGGDDGLYRIRPRLIRVVGTAEGLQGPNVYSIFEARNGDWWIGVWGSLGGLTRMRGARMSVHPTRNFVSALLEDQAGTLWVGTLDLMCRMQGDRCETVELPVSPTFTHSVNALHEDGQGRLWIGGDHGLAVGVPGTSGRTWKGHPLDHSIRAIVETADGDILLGSAGSGLGRYVEDGQIEWLTSAHGLASDHVRDVYADPAGILWIATEDRGLCRLDRAGQASLRTGRLLCLDTDEGLFDNSLHRIIPDGFGRLWMSTNRGIFWVEHGELEAFARGAISAISSVSYTERDGMRNREANGGRQPAGIRASDGRLLFPTQDGVVIIDPSRVQPPEAPPVVIESVRVGERVHRADGEVVLAAGQRDVDIDYAALAFSSPEDVRFRYILEGYDTAWKEAGAGRRATYTNLPPGTYTFRVKAGLGGAWSERGAAFTFTRQPFFWETSWFYAVVALFFIASGPSTYLYRVRRLKARQEILEQMVAERTAQIRTHEVELERQADELRRANALKSRFLANVSHEFRTPLTLTFGPLRDLLSGRYTVDPKARPMIERAVRNGQRLLRLINQLLELSRLDAGYLTLKPRAADLVVFLRQRIAAFEPLARDWRITLKFVPDAGAIAFSFDAEKLETIVLNLVSNAFKFTPEGGTVVVAVRLDEAGNACLVVRDTGIGIASEHLPYLFDRFYQVDESTTRPREGTGIGLALVRQLIELHGGSIVVESMVGTGSTFTVSLPPPPEVDGDPGSQPAATNGDASCADGVLADLHAHTAPAPVADLAEAADDEATVVLVVEDNADMRAYIRAHLEGRYQVEEAANGAAALDRAVALVPDLVLTDVMMPEMDGYALLSALKSDERTSHVPVVLLTARADAESRIAGLETGADDYLAKPFEAAELLARVDNLIAQRRQLRARWARSLLTPDALEVPSMEAAFLSRVKEMIEARMAEPSFGVDALADEVGMSPRQLRRKLTGLLDESPNELIRRFRMERAAALLGKQAMSAKEVAAAVGFRSVPHFTELFLETYGTTPGEYAQRQR